MRKSKEQQTYQNNKNKQDEESLAAIEICFLFVEDMAEKEHYKDREINVAARPPLAKHFKRGYWGATICVDGC